MPRGRWLGAREQQGDALGGGVGQPRGLDAGGRQTPGQVPVLVLEREDPGQESAGSFVTGSFFGRGVMLFSENTLFPTFFWEDRRKGGAGMAVREEGKFTSSQKKKAGSKTNGRGQY